MPSPRVCHRSPRLVSRRVSEGGDVSHMLPVFWVQPSRTHTTLHYTTCVPVPPPPTHTACVPPTHTLPVSQEELETLQAETTALMQQLQQTKQALQVTEMRVWRVCSPGAGGWSLRLWGATEGDEVLSFVPLMAHGWVFCLYLKF
jgi:hypothetical protein